MKRPRPTRESFDKTKIVERISLDLCDWLDEDDLSKKNVKEWSNTICNESEINDGSDLALRFINDLNIMKDIDSELISILDNLENITYSYLQEDIKEWVQKMRRKAKFKAGKEVEVDGKKGEIVSIKERTAQYLIFFEELGHVRKGVGAHGLLFNYEDIE